MPSPLLEDDPLPDWPQGRTTTNTTTTTTSPPSPPTITTTRPSDDRDPVPPWAPRPTPAGARRLSSRRAAAAQHHHHEGPKTPQSLVATLLSASTSLTTHLLRLYLRLTPTQRVLAAAAAVAALALGVTLLVFSHHLFGLLTPLAAAWRAHPLGWLPLWLATFFTAFPPVIGYSTCVTAAGFVYGFPLGWPVAASATLAGSTAAFLTSRGVFARYVQGLVGRDKRFIALGQVLRRDGLGVLVMVRLCPLPYSLSNGFLATVGSVGASGFALATAGATPKLLVHVFIGSRLALLAESGDKMTGWDLAINYISMAVFGLLGFAVGLLIYRRTMARAAELAREAELEAGDALLDNTGADDDLEQGVLGVDLENGRMVDPDELDAAALMDDDDISLWDAAGGVGYRDSWDDEPALQSAVSGPGDTR
ncbi:hypothetical protein N658DRAFT_417324 [Parathielavia hyrcaniae]|uniref:Golgi apparatus membrane protein TVP38 n=1 Tax=Parathielavia hyrcaniae TaxID=113614 RepID=A0AAN6QE29_9PEZI|nr:hypothetical protein N658DRAFT_417324 [Parathielavia hyrcaniae]